VCLVKHNNREYSEGGHNQVTSFVEGDRVSVRTRVSEGGNMLSPMKREEGCDERNRVVRRETMKNRRKKKAEKGYSNVRI